MLPLLLAAVFSVPTATLVCRFTGVIMPVQTCCPEPVVPGAATVTLRDQDCCAVRTSAFPTLLAEHAPRSGWGCEQGDAPAPSAILPLRPPTAADAPRLGHLRLTAFRPPPLSFKRSLLI